MKTASEQTFFENLDKVKGFLKGQHGIKRVLITRSGQIVLYWDWSEVSRNDVEKEMVRMGFTREDYFYDDDWETDTIRTRLK